MIRIYLPKEIKAANEEGHRLKAQIDKLTKDAQSLQSSDKVIGREESDERGRLEGLKKLVSEGLVMKRDEKATANEIIRLTEELQGIQKKRAENGKQLAGIQGEIKKLQAELDTYFAIEIPEEKSKEPVIHNAMSASMGSQISNVTPAKEIESHPHHLTSRG